MTTSNQDRLEQIKNYIQKVFGKQPKPVAIVNNECAKLDLPKINVPAHVGKLISILTMLKKPKRVLEIGTLGGYSTSWIASSLQPEAKIVTIEINEYNAKKALENFKLANIDQQIDLLVGDAIDILSQMIKNNEDKFDLFFIDADKENYSTYLKMIKQLAHEEALIISDNLIPKWKDIENPHHKDEMAKSIYSYNIELVDDKDLQTAISTTLVGINPRIDAMGISIFKKD